MKKVFLHSKKVIGKFWFLIAIAWAISFVFGIGLFLILLVLSMLFTGDPVDVKALMNEFTEEELETVLADNVDEKVSDDRYITLMARYQTHFCPRKLDRITTWLGSEVTTESYIRYYELKREIEGFSAERLKECILRDLNSNRVLVIRLARTNRNMVFRYTYKTTGETFDIVISNEELKAA